jgi:hypothetical protein
MIHSVIVIVIPSVIHSIIHISIIVSIAPILRNPGGFDFARFVVIAVIVIAVIGVDAVRHFITEFMHAKLHFWSQQMPMQLLPKLHTRGALSRLFSSLVDQCGRQRQGRICHC